MGKALFPADQSAGLREWTIGDLLDAAADRASTRSAVRDGELVWTYADLKTHSNRLASYLLTLFRPGEHVAIWGANSAPWLLYQMAAAKAGLVLVTLNPALRTVEMEALLRQSRSVGVIVDDVFRGTQLPSVIGEVRASLLQLREVLRIEDWAANVARAPAAAPEVSVSPDDTAMILFTSGTTGKPKGVRLHHRGIVNSALLGASLYQIEDGLSWLSIMPFFHIGGSCTTNLGCIGKVSTNVVVRAFDPGEVLRLIEAERIAWFPCVPTMAIGLIEHPNFRQTDLSSVQVIQTGGAPVTPDFIRLLLSSFGADVQVMFGQTEAGGVMCTNRRNSPVDLIASTVGSPLPHTSLKISRPATGETVQTGEVGEIRISSPFMTKGYFDNPDATAAAFDAEGYLCTGDLGSLDDIGLVRVTGRLKEMIIRGGENIYPREIEDRLGEFPNVSECAVIGVPSERWGEEVAVAIRCSAGTTIDVEAARAFLLDRLARHKVPKIWKIVEDFPRTPSGKIQKFELVQIFKGGAPG